MIHKDEATLKKLAIMKTARAAVRTHFSIKADEALNEILPELEEAFDKAIAAGKPFTFDSEIVARKLLELGAGE